MPGARVGIQLKNENESEQMKKNKLIQGFTLVEIMIVVAIIAILAAIAIPNFVNSRKKSQAKACVANMKQIFGASEQWKLAGNAGVPTVAQLIDPAAGFIKASTAPACPAGGTYTLTDTDCTCSIAATLGVGYEHVLP